MFAYVQNRGSKKGGGYVTLTVSEPKFVSLEWKDANEKKTRYMGRRHVVYAHTKFEGTGDILVEARFYYKSLNGKTISYQFCTTSYRTGWYGKDRTFIDKQPSRRDNPSLSPTFA